MHKFFIIVSLLLCHVVFGESTNILNVGVYQLEPHMMLKNEHQLKGAAIDLFTEISKKLNIIVHFKILPFARNIQYIKDGTIDAVLLIAKTTERLNYIEYSSSPLFIDQNGFIVKKTSSLKELNSVSSNAELLKLSNLRVGHVLNSIIPDYLKNSQIKWDLVSNSDYFASNIQRLLYDRIDVIFVPTLSHGKWRVKDLSENSNKRGQNENLVDKLQFIPINYSESSIELYVGFRKNIQKKIVENYNKEFEINAKSGRYKDLLNQY